MKKIYLYHWRFTLEALQLPRCGSLSQDFSASYGGSCLLDPRLSFRAVLWAQGTFPCLPAEPAIAELINALPLLWSPRGISKVTFDLLNFSLQFGSIVLKAPFSIIWTFLFALSFTYLLSVLCLSLQRLKIGKSSSFFAKFSQRSPPFFLFKFFYSFYIPVTITPPIPPSTPPCLPLPCFLPPHPHSSKRVRPMGSLNLVRSVEAGPIPFSLHWGWARHPALGTDPGCIARAPQTKLHNCLQM